MTDTTQKVFLIALDDQDILRASGDDTTQFLQGQLSCDVEALADRHSSLGCICNTQGRIVSAFRILRHGDEYYLALPDGMGAIAQQHLSRYAVFFKTGLTEDDGTFRRIGLAGSGIAKVLATHFGTLPDAGDTLKAGESAYLINLGEADDIPRFELWIPGPEADGLIEQLQQDGLEEGTPEDWQWLSVQAGEILPLPSQSELFTPEELNLDLGDAVSFTKGCYTGQEVVARMHYRGKGKKRLALFHAANSLRDDQTLPEPDASLSLQVADNERLALPVVALARHQDSVIGLCVGNLDRLPEQAILSTGDGETLTVHLARP